MSTRDVTKKLLNGYLSKQSKKQKIEIYFPNIVHKQHKGTYFWGIERISTIKFK